MEGAFLSGGFRWLAARLTHWLIERSLRSHFCAVYLRLSAPPDAERGAILFANHHYWWDGYLAYWLVCATWRRDGIVWMEQWRRFPPFGVLGAMPFPPHQPVRRATTIRRTLKRLQTGNPVLVLFPEGVLHRSEGVLPFGRALHWLAQKMPDLPLIPLAIHIEPRYHQYPCAYLSLGAPFRNNAPESEWLAQARATLEAELASLRASVQTITSDEQHRACGFECLLRGKLSAHERWSTQMS